MQLTSVGTCEWIYFGLWNGHPLLFQSGGDGDEDFGDVDGDNDGDDGDNDDDDDDDHIIVEYSVDSGATYLTPHLTPHSGPCHLIYQPHHPHISWR